MTVPTCLLTYTSLADCAQAMVAHNGSRRALTPHGQVLYDYCIQYGVTKLSPCSCYQSKRLSGPDVLYAEYGAEFPVLVHQWLVYMVLLGDFSHSMEMGPQYVRRNLIDWLLVPSNTNRWKCEAHGPHGTVLRFVYRPEMFQHHSNRSRLAYRLCHAIYEKGHLPPMTESLIQAVQNLTADA